jgi:hypothetical protein
MLGSHERRVLFFENGTLLPYCFVFPWNRPSCDRLNGWLRAAARDGKEGNMVAFRRPVIGLAQFSCAANRQASQGARTERGSGGPKTASPNRGTHAKGHMGSILILTTRALRGCNQESTFAFVLVGINLSGPLSSFGGVRTCPERKKKPPDVPLFFRNLCLVLLYLHTSEGVGVRTSSREPRCGTAYAPRSEPCAPPRGARLILIYAALP